MSLPLLVLAPLRVEAAALGRSTGWRLLRSGMGPERARVAAARALAVEGASGIAVAGLGAAALPGIEPGDVVLASELRGADHEVAPVPGSALLAAALRRRGLRVHVGPIASLDHITEPSERRRLGAEGVLAVDMESLWLAEAAGERPFAVLRVVVETNDRKLIDPRTPVAGIRALAALRRAGRALEEWAAALSPRRVLLAAPRSFCAGVDRAIEIVELALEQHGPPVYVRKQIVHNEHVVADLERRGAVFVGELDEIPPGATTVFSAHGVSPAVRQAASARGLEVIDATCPLVSKVHAEARRFAAGGSTVFLVGHEGHEEIEGTYGEAPESTILVQDLDDAARVVAPDPDRVAYLTQTTLAVDETAQIVQVLRDRYPALRGPSSDDICYATTNRQQAVREIAGESDVVLVVGSRTSSNSRRLVEVAEREGIPAHLVDDETDIDVAWLEGVSTVGLSAGASAPEALVERLIAGLDALGGVEVEERTTATESLRFRLPREVASP
ncbi:MAG TPA: 4-hydroxy-3-methylbut-2-enyl diphosphate reductase [Gaiellaceae bacterium]|nr:4-hydroxy-3-methylbut-2-enyl diphosphate reductase [Gaiellaceae bacterium]